ncbi:hypothetical protein CHARACLAT_026385 [Characodon lateralis]|uniref:Calponin-homology (CH) domain-containing protein n=1 Tax=Characodon lateralis TaxID=208331 RepID=A0ABU7D1H8_9TELE|nr:hypothetical protein [Characodon lateralis]
MSGSHPRLHQSAATAPNALSSDKDAEMPATEKDLAEDAPWKKIQQNTFTRWCNEHLKCVNKRIGNLQTDLSDGLRLIGLLEVLSQKKMFRKYNQRPTFRQMQLENVSVALEFLDKENIKLVSIESSREEHQELDRKQSLTCKAVEDHVLRLNQNDEERHICILTLTCMFRHTWKMLLHPNK